MSDTREMERVWKMRNGASIEFTGPAEPHPLGPATDFAEDCMQWRGRILTGRYAHWCYDWDGLPVDETTADEFDCCTCYSPASVFRLNPPSGE